MPRKRSDRNGEIPLPAGWEIDTDFDGRQFYIDHNTKQTSWIDPRDRFTKPATFADCVGDELPYGWEQAIDPHLGIYYINHLQQITQVEDPRLQWRAEQETMLRDYLDHAHEDLAAKKEIFQVKQERLVIAQEEVQNLNRTLASQWKTSRTSLNSTMSAVSTCSTKYDPDLLKADVNLAKNRVARLKREVAQARAEVQYSEQGLQTLQHVDEKMGGGEQPNMFSAEEAQHILSRIRSNQQSISASHRLKKHLLQSLAKLKGTMTKGQLESSSPDVSREKLSTASQTDLSWEVGPSQDKRLGEMVRMQLQYDEALKQVSHLQQQLADIEDQMDPTQAESDKDRLLLIQEKEQLLRELRGIKSSGRSAAEMEDIGARVAQLELDLTHAMQLSNRQIAERLKLNENKSEILQKLADATHLTTYLESQLRGLSMSTLSVSSGSSRGSLGSLSTGSKGSLSSLSITDIYTPSQLSLPEHNLVELHRRVEKLLQGHQSPAGPAMAVAPAAPHAPAAGGVGIGSGENVGSVGHSTGSPALSNSGSHSMKSLSPGSSLSSLSPPVSPYEVGPPPSYNQHLQRQRQASPASCGGLGGVGGMGTSVSPIQELEGDTAVQQAVGEQLAAMTISPAEGHPHRGNPVTNLQQSTPQVAAAAAAAVNQNPSLLAQPLSDGDASDTTPNMAAASEAMKTGALPIPLHPPTHPHHQHHHHQAPATHSQPRVPPPQLPIQDSVAAPPASHPMPRRNPERLLGSMENYSSSGEFSSSNPPLSPISESSSGVCNNLSGGNTRSVSAAVSDESVAGDSGVFEAAVKRSVELDGVFPMLLECAQIQLKLKYEGVEGQLHIGIEQARNLHALAFPSNMCQVCIKAALLPSSGTKSIFCTRPSSEINSPKFIETFCVPIQETKLASKTLHVHVWCVGPQKDADLCLGSAQVSLSAFDAKHVSLKWYNILSFKFMQEHQAVPTEGVATEGRTAMQERPPPPYSAHPKGDKVQQLLQDSSEILQQKMLLGNHEGRGMETQKSRVPPGPSYSTELGMSTPPAAAAVTAAAVGAGAGISSVKEESSDESTIISSQTSTLTRNHGPGDMEEGRGREEEEEDVEGNETEEEEEEEEEGLAELDQNTIKQCQTPMLQALLTEQAMYGNLVPQSAMDDSTLKAITTDKETNTDVTQPGRQGKQGQGKGAASATPIRRSQTFSPVTKVHDYICKLYRSDSDSSVGTSKQRRGGHFQRNTTERRSMRLKKPLSMLKKTLSFNAVETQRTRTSIDLELDLRASEVKLGQLKDEIARLEEFKRRLEDARGQGLTEPAWLADNEELQQFLAQADSLLAGQQKKSGCVEEKAERLMQRVTKDAKKIRRRQRSEPDIRSFKEKMAFFTTMSVGVPILPNEADADVEDNLSQCTDLTLTSQGAGPDSDSASEDAFSQCSDPHEELKTPEQ